MSRAAGVNSEKQWAETLKAYKLPASRATDRIMNYSISDDDVHIEGFPWIRSDSKYRAAGFLNSKLLRDIEKKYCKKKGFFGILISKHLRQIGQDCTVKDEFLAMMLSVFLGFTTRDEALAIYDTRNK